MLAHVEGFHTFDKRDLRGTGRWLTEHGVAAFAVTIGWRPPTPRPGTRPPQDLVCALGWVGEHAERFSIDASRVSLGDRSAGGILD